MAEVTMTVQNKMREEMLNNWRGKTNYGVILTQVSGQPNPDIGDSKLLSFGSPTATTGGRKITHDGPTDLTVYSGQNVLDFRITRDNTNSNSIPHAATNINELYEYGGVFRINKIEITLT